MKVSEDSSTHSAHVRNGTGRLANTHQVGHYRWRPAHTHTPTHTPVSKKHTNHLPLPAHHWSRLCNYNVNVYSYIYLYVQNMKTLNSTRSRNEKKKKHALDRYKHALPWKWDLKFSPVHFHMLIVSPPLLLLLPPTIKMSSSAMSRVAFWSRL